jgi:hypothetical protein
MAQLPAVSPRRADRRDLAVSVPWYERLLGTKPVLNQETNGPGGHRRGRAALIRGPVPSGPSSQHPWSPGQR